MAHCVEAFTSKRAHPIIDGYALQGIELVGKYLRRAVTDGADAEARAAMALASLYGGICLGSVNTTAGHAIAYLLGTRNKLAHGIANPLIFPYVLAENAVSVPEKTEKVCNALGFAFGESEVVRAGARAFCEALGLDMRLRAQGVPENDLRQWRWKPMPSAGCSTETRSIFRSRRSRQSTARPIDLGGGAPCDPSQ